MKETLDSSHWKKSNEWSQVAVARVSTLAKSWWQSYLPTSPPQKGEWLCTRSCDLTNKVWISIDYRERSAGRTSGLRHLVNQDKGSSIMLAQGLSTPRQCEQAKKTGHLRIRIRSDQVARNQQLAKQANQMLIARDYRKPLPQNKRRTLMIRSSIGTSSNAPCQ